MTWPHAAAATGRSCQDRDQAWKHVKRWPLALYREMNQYISLYGIVAEKEDPGTGDMPGTAMGAS